jgi:hypothetical protein
MLKLHHIMQKPSSSISSPIIYDYILILFSGNSIFISMGFGSLS